MNEKFTKLKNLGAGEFEHLNGSLIKHLNRTYELLSAWGAQQKLCDAGLYHAAYGTAGFDAEVVSLSRRSEIIQIIGKEAEDLVYLYCSCDRDFVFSNFSATSDILFKDRFTGKKFVLTELQVKQFCELTVANELELAISSNVFLAQHGQGLFELFSQFSPFLSQQANDAVKSVLVNSR
jgi:hypothetical protein